jgi:predicted nucleic acid-binding protein
MMLVDTSAWVEFFRGRGKCANAVDAALAADEVALCGPVLIELRRGFASVAERRKVIPLLEGCHQLEQPAQLWREAGDLGYALRARGITAKTLHLLIATYALTYAVPILARDKDFSHMQRAGIPLIVRTS